MNRVWGAPWILYLVSWILILTSQTFAAEQIVRVSILSLLRPQQITLTLESPAMGMLKGGGSERPWLAGKPFEIDSTDGRLQSPLGIAAPHIRFECSVPCQTRLEIPGEMERVYTGSLDFYYDNNTILIVLIPDIESLTASIAVSEMREVREREAIKAFAIVIRSFLTQGNRHPEKAADSCDTTHCQVFQNLAAGPEIREAVRQTESLVLSYHDQSFRPFYSRSCGGSTSTYQEAWGRPSGGYAFPTVSCPCSNVDTQWRTSLTELELSSMTGLQTPDLLRQGNRIVVSQGDVQTSYSVEGFRSKVGRAFGWKRLPGNHYRLLPTANGYDFEGIGQGHGVGFCQTGAAILAGKGLSFSAILSHYFPATELKSTVQYEVLTTKITK